MNDILKAAQALRNDIAAWRRALHAIPEMDRDLPQTRAFVCSRLEALGIPYRTFEGDSSVCAWIRGGGSGGTVALRADMDALHITELTGLPYASTNGNMHACGHDAHTAMLLGAASILRGMGETLRGNVTLLFQSGEEGSGGAERMIAAGALDEPPVDVVFGQHAGQLSPELPGGMFGFYPGTFMASRDTFYLTVRGQGCHGSTPAAGVDPVVVSAYLITALQTLVSRECNGTDTAVLTIGSIHGGEVYNIIPDQVELQGAIRCLDEGKRAELERRITELAKGLCASMRAECDVAFEHGYPVLVNDDGATAFAAGCARELLGGGAVRMLRQPLMSSEDMSLLPAEKAGVLLVLRHAAGRRPGLSQPQPPLPAGRVHIVSGLRAAGRRGGQMAGGA